MLVGKGEAGGLSSPDPYPPRAHLPGQTSGHPLDALLPRYYALRGWDTQGVPTAKTLEKLQIRHSA